jgi:hypothetical protein
LSREPPQKKPERGRPKKRRRGRSNAIELWETIPLKRDRANIAVSNIYRVCLVHREPP